MIFHTHIRTYRVTLILILERFTKQLFFGINDYASADDCPRLQFDFISCRECLMRLRFWKNIIFVRVLCSSLCPLTNIRMREPTDYKRSVTFRLQHHTFRENFLRSLRDPPRFPESGFYPYFIYRLPNLTLSRLHMLIFYTVPKRIKH